ncbi:MAG: SDR family oxidoreductase [Candidatus Micrarchaeota archaeon]
MTSGDFEMHAVVLGGSGLAGESIALVLMESGFKVSYTYFSNALEIPGAKGFRLDVSDAGALDDFLEARKPGFVVNTVALPSVDKCDVDEELAFKVNAEPQRVLAGYSMRSGAAIAFMSTSNVFGPSGRPLVEDDIPGPISAYGRTKLRGEEYTLLSKKHIILRADQIYGWTRHGQKHTFVEKTLEKLNGGSEVEVCRDWYNCPTYAGDIAAALARLVTKGRWGVYHSVGSTYLNRYEWALTIANVFGFDGSLVKPIDSSSLNLPAKRSNCALSNKKITMESGVRFLSVDEGMKKMKEEEPRGRG